MLWLLGCLPVIWAGLLVGQSLGGGLADIMESLSNSLATPWTVRWTAYSLPAVLLSLLCYGLALSIYSSEQGKRRDGEEHGSAAWGNPRQVNAEFAQKENKLLTQNVRLGLDTHKHRRSLNVLVIGGSGAAKTRGYVKPNILQANTNYVVTDPKEVRPDRV